MLQIMAQRTDDDFSIDAKRDFRGRGFADGLCDVFVDGIAYRDKTEKCPIFLWSKVKRLRGYFKNSVTKSEQCRVGFLKVCFERLSYADLIKCRALIVGCY